MKLLPQFTDSKSSTSPDDPVSLNIISDQATETMSARLGESWQSPIEVITNGTYSSKTWMELSEATDGGAPYGFPENLVLEELGCQTKAGAADTCRFGLEYRIS